MSRRVILVLELDVAGRKIGELAAVIAAAGAAAPVVSSQLLVDGEPLGAIGPVKARPRPAATRRRRTG